MCGSQPAVLHWSFSVPCDWVRDSAVLRITTLAWWRAQRPSSVNCPAEEVCPEAWFSYNKHSALMIRTIAHILCSGSSIFRTSFPLKRWYFPILCWCLHWPRWLNIIEQLCKKTAENHRAQSHIFWRRSMKEELVSWCDRSSSILCTLLSCWFTSPTI